jgi:hypothetical protein
MLLIQSLVLYGLAGVGVGVAFLLRGSGAPGPRVLFALASVPFWPLLVPLLLMPARSESRGPERAEPVSASRLRAALAGLDGLSHELAAPELARIRGLSKAMTALEERVREMDVLLGTPEFDLVAAERSLKSLEGRGIAPTDARVASARAHLRNIAALKSLRERSAGDLERVCLQIEAIPAQLKLLRFAGGNVFDQAALTALRDVADAMQAMTEELVTDAAGAPELSARAT